jgi:hypothetical protein
MGAAPQTDRRIKDPLEEKATVKAFAIVHRPPHPRSDDVPQFLRMIVGPGAKEHGIEMATELAAVNAGAFGVVPLDRGRRHRRALPRRGGVRAGSQPRWHLVARGCYV